MSMAQHKPLILLSPTFFLLFIPLPFPHLCREKGAVGGEGASPGLSRTRAAVLTMEKLIFAAFQTHVGNPLWQLKLQAD